MWIASRLVKESAVQIGNQAVPIEMVLADDSVGVLLVFKTKKAAQKYAGKNAGVIECHFKDQPQ